MSLKQLQLGKLTLPSNIIYAPLAGCSDFAFRKMSACYKPGLMYCEMVKMDALIRNNQNTLDMLDYDPSMYPIGAQVCGSKPEIAAQSAKMIEDLGFSVLDYNCGCPVDKVTKDGSGSGMLKTPELIGEIIAKMVAAVEIPVTVKIRAGWDENSINAVEITKIAEAAGAKAICIHGRTRQQAYKGFANWDYIKACKEAAQSILVLGNGDLFDADAVKRIFAHTGCDGVVVSRGTMGQPWIMEDIQNYLIDRPIKERSIEELRQALLTHFEYTLEYHEERKAVLDMRRVGCWYFKKSYRTRGFRDQISRAETVQQIRELITHYPFEEASDELPDSAICES